ncbi:unnamed protein product [Thlaspi arvense]|uniref:Ribulose bisphosphate carboxylase small subunit n=1 Tax=Thlaspi arvense TaxID=13288 RepID=A0AAU9T8T5_THLAR|nr:unnamed protein product [Thlaspi arvense]
MPGYYDGRYWTMWKLPMFGCNDSSQVLNEIQECKRTYPNAYIRCLAFDNKHQGQCMAFIIQKAHGLRLKALLLDSLLKPNKPIWLLLASVGVYF